MVLNYGPTQCLCTSCKNKQKQTCIVLCYIQPQVLINQRDGPLDDDSSSSDDDGPVTGGGGATSRRQAFPNIEEDDDVEEEEDAETVEEGDALNSDDDDDEVTPEQLETKNLVLCRYEKVLYRPIFSCSYFFQASK